MQVIALWLRQAQTWAQTRRRAYWREWLLKRMKRRNWRCDRWEPGHEPAVCTCGPEGQQNPELHQKKDGQQGEGSDCESPHTVLHRSLVPSTGKMSCWSRSKGAGAKKGHKDLFILVILVVNLMGNPYSKI